MSSSDIAMTNTNSVTVDTERASGSEQDDTQTEEDSVTVETERASGTEQDDTQTEEDGNNAQKDDQKTQCIGYRLWYSYCSWKTLFMPYANNKGAGQPAHSRSPIKTFVIRCLDSIIPLISISKFLSFYAASLAAQAGFLVTSLTYSHNRIKTIRSVDKKWAASWQNQQNKNVIRYCVGLII